jgi:hypothetical protein
MRCSRRTPQEAIVEDAMVEQIFYGTGAEGDAIDTVARGVELMYTADSILLADGWLGALRIIQMIDKAGSGLTCQAQLGFGI